MGLFSWIFKNRGQKVQEFLDKNALLLDVRNPDEVKRDHILTAKNIPVSQLATRTNELDPKRPIIAYCASGGRSAMAVQVLRSKGFAAVNAGGINQMRKYLDL